MSQEQNSQKELAKGRTNNGYKNGRRNPWFFYFMILVLVIAVGYLYYDNYLIKGELDAVLTELNATKSNLSQLSSDLIYIRSIAQNADSYAHSHYSDARLKENVKPIDNTLVKVITLQGVSFYWDTSRYPASGKSSGQQFGVIAQDVEKVFPELVSTGPDGYKRVDYDGLTILLLEAIKQQQQTISIFEKRILELEK